MLGDRRFRRLSICGVTVELLLVISEYLFDREERNLWALELERPGRLGVVM